MTLAADQALLDIIYEQKNLQPNYDSVGL